MVASGVSAIEFYAAGGALAVLCVIAVALLRQVGNSGTVVAQAVRIQYELWSVAYHLEQDIVDVYADHVAMTDGWQSAGRMHEALRDEWSAYAQKKCIVIEEAQQRLDALQQQATNLRAENDWFGKLFDAYCEDYPSLGLLDLDWEGRA